MFQVGSMKNAVVFMALILGACGRTSDLPECNPEEGCTRVRSGGVSNNPIWDWNAGEGFTKVKTENGQVVAWKWIRAGREIQIKSMKGCDSLYVSANLLDASGTVVDDSIDSARNLAPDQSARLEFSWGRKDGRVQISEINCYLL